MTSLGGADDPFVTAPKEKAPTTGAFPRVNVSVERADVRTCVLTMRYDGRQFQNRGETTKVAPTTSLRAACGRPRRAACVPKASR